ncbi:hypothetical protein EDB83DRAFT_2320650 [Lactarius deliciosus]|nr:hypothetical protein EDB83DRAFT_2320650 [Lactarius deliciosus]
MAYGRILGGQVRRVCAKASRSPSGRFSLYAARSGRYHLSVASGSLSHESRDPSSRPTSTIFLSPDTTDRHPFYAISAASAGVSGVTPLLPSQRSLFGPRQYIWRSLPCLRGAMCLFRSYRRLPDHLLLHLASIRASAADLYMGLATSKTGILVVLDSATTVGVGPELAHRRKLLIGGLNGLSPHLRRRVARVASVLAYLTTLSSKSCCAIPVALCARTARDPWGRRMHLCSPWLAYGHLPRAGQLPTSSLTLSYRGYIRAKKDIARGSHRRRVQCILGVTCLRSTNVKVREYVADGQGVPHGCSVCADFSNSPSHCVFGAIATIGSGEEMESESGNLESVSLAISATMVPGLRSGISVLFPSGTRNDIMDSVVGGQEYPYLDKISSSSVLVSLAQPCLRARDIIQLGRSRVYAETVDEFREYFGSGKVADVSALVSQMAIRLPPSVVSVSHLRLRFLVYVPPALSRSP